MENLIDKAIEAAGSYKTMRTLFFWTALAMAFLMGVSGLVGSAVIAGYCAWGATLSALGYLFNNYMFNKTVKNLDKAVTAELDSATTKTGSTSTT